MKPIFYNLILFCFLSFSVIAQSKEQYLVNAPKVNLRLEPSKDSELLGSLQPNDVVTVIEKLSNGWWYIDFDGTEGYVLGKLLKRDPNVGWDRKKYTSGETPDCENIIPEYDRSIPNYLKVNVGSNTDVVVKLMKKNISSEDICIRIVFIRSGQSFKIENVPEGDYYLKLAYGKDWRQKIVDNQCFGKFMTNAHYEIGKQKLNFNKSQNGDYERIPSFELSLDVVTTKIKKSNYNSNQISEAIFNK